MAQPPFNGLLCYQLNVAELVPALAHKHQVPRSHTSIRCLVRTQALGASFAHKHHVPRLHTSIRCLVRTQALGASFAHKHQVPRSHTSIRCLVRTQASGASFAHKHQVPPCCSPAGPAIWPQCACLWLCACTHVVWFSKQCLQAGIQTLYLLDLCLCCCTKAKLVSWPSW